MSLTIIHGLLLVVFIASIAGVQIEATPPAGICPDGTLEAPNNGCFQFINNHKTFSDAEDSCFSIGGHLAVADSLFVNTFLAEQAGKVFNFDNFWIGANVYTKLASKPWVWTDKNQLVIYADWANGQPSGGETNGGQCASASVLDGTWSAVDCNSNKPYVCEIPRIIYSCPSEWIYYDYTKSCYKDFIDANWQGAEDYCLAQNAHLTSIHCKEENNFIISIAQSGQNQTSDAGQTWIGFFTDTNDNRDYRWSDGSSVDYVNWASGQPNNPGIQNVVHSSGSCPDGTLEAPNNGCFQFINNHKTFSDAEDSCFSIGGHLAVADSLFVNTFLAEQAGKVFNSDDFWIGANVYTKLASKPWVWTDKNQLVVYADWANGQPSGGETGGDQCVAVSVLDRTWSAVDCNSNKPYVCEIPRIIYSCPSEWIYYDYTKSCYKDFIDANWQGAEDYCLAQNAHLTSIHCKEENNFIISIAQSGQNQTSDAGQTWIGFFTDTNDNRDYRWSDGSPFDYINWRPGAPHNPGTHKCVGLWYDFPNSGGNNHFDNNECGLTKRNYVCKKSATVLNLN